MVQTIELNYTDEDELIISREDLFNSCVMASFIAAHDKGLTGEALEEYCDLTAEFAAMLIHLLYAPLDEEDAQYVEDTCEVGGYA